MYFLRDEQLYFPWVRDFSICKTSVKIIFEFSKYVPKVAFGFYEIVAKRILGLCKISAKLAFELWA